MTQLSGQTDDKFNEQYTRPCGVERLFDDLEELSEKDVQRGDIGLEVALGVKG